MTLNKVKGNMYSFVNFTWNAIKGKCPHDCSYCYCKRWGKQSELHFDEKELKTNLGENNFIFVGSSCDMFAKHIPDIWIKKVLAKCLLHKNKYLFQTKNPKRFFEFDVHYPEDYILGITLETNRENNLDNTPMRSTRVDWFSDLNKGIRRMVTIEPIMDFDLRVLATWIKKIKPEFVNIGADSGNNNLPEPSKEKIEALIKELRKFTKVNLKDNLKRIYS
jgi:DNA repair photolyase